MTERESMDFDVVIVGAGPAGLGAAIRLRQLCEESGQELSVCVVEKGSEVGAHILSGAVLEPRALDELIPDWRDLDTPIKTAVKADEFRFLTAKGSLKFPHLFMPSQFKNKGNYIISLGNLCRWLAGRAEDMGVEVYPGFAAAEVLYGEDGRVEGVATGVLISMVAFAVSCCRVDVVRDRPRSVDPEVHVARLQGYLFFGTAASLSSIDSSSRTTSGRWTSIARRSSCCLVRRPRQFSCMNRRACSWTSRWRSTWRTGSTTAW